MPVGTELCYILFSKDGIKHDLNNINPLGTILRLELSACGERTL